MFDASSSPSSPRVSTQVPAGRGRLVTDAPVRTFHLLFALSFLGAWLTAESERWRLLHAALGYTLAGLLGARLLYGLFGPRHASLRALWHKLTGAPACLRGLCQWHKGGRIDARSWQNLFMAMTVLGLLGLTLPLVLSGHAVDAAWGSGLVWGPWTADEALAEVHEFLAHAFLLLVLAHLALVAGLSLWRRQNQALPMLTGRFPGAGPDLVKRPRWALAVLLVAAVLAFWSWMDWRAPQGLIPSTSVAALLTAPLDDD